MVLSFYSSFTRFALGNCPSDSLLIWPMLSLRLLVPLPRPLLFQSPWVCWKKRMEWIKEYLGTPFWIFPPFFSMVKSDWEPFVDSCCPSALPSTWTVRPCTRPWPPFSSPKFVKCKWVSDKLSLYPLRLLLLPLALLVFHKLGWSPWLWFWIPLVCQQKMSLWFLQSIGFLTGMSFQIFPHFFQFSLFIFWENATIR